MTETTEGYETLLRDALRRPGVKELIEVHHECEEIMRQFNACRRAITPQLVAWNSDHTEQVEGKVEIPAPV